MTKSKYKVRDLNGDFFITDNIIDAVNVHNRNVHLKPFKIRFNLKTGKSPITRRVNGGRFNAPYMGDIIKQGFNDEGEAIFSSRESTIIYLQRIGLNPIDYGMI